MSLVRAVLVLNAAFVLVSGIACVLAPASLAQQTGFSVAASALTEVRAFYGGLQVGLAWFLFWCARRREMIVPALLLIAVAVGGAGIARLLGMLIDRAPTSFHLTNLAIEIVTVSVITVALYRMKSRA